MFLQDFLETDYGSITSHLCAALLAGGVIGLERSFHGRPAGFRTHTLVCLTSSLLMIVTIYQGKWFPGMSTDTVRTDPMRMAQGIMTGIGFLGSGVIFKEGLSVRGLTTAGSIWITAAIGILFGVGFYFPAIVATILVLGTLSVFRWIEAKIPSQSYAHHHVSFHRNNVMPEDQLREFLTARGFTVANMSYRIVDEGRTFEYRMILRTNNSANSARLAVDLLKLEQVQGFRISPMGD